MLIKCFFSLPGHFLLLTRQSLISEISGQGLPKGDGYWRTCLVRVSWPRLKPQVRPDLEQGLQSLHSPTLQCTDSRNTGKKSKAWVIVSTLLKLKYISWRYLTLQCTLHQFVIGLVVVWTDVVTPSAELVKTRSASCARFTAPTQLTLFRAPWKRSYIPEQSAITG